MTLQELCITAIGRSYERFYYAYCTTDNDSLRAGFQLLQKFYCSQLVSCIGTDKKAHLPDNYADMLFSKYLKSIHTSWFLRFSWKAIFDTFAKIGPGLESVVFYEDSQSLLPVLFNRDSNCLNTRNIICYLPNVKEIICQRFCNNYILESIAKYCPRLEILDVNYSDKVTDAGFKYFYQKEQGKVPCPLLKEIILASTFTSFKAIKGLFQNLPLLEKMDHCCLPRAMYSLHKDDLSSLDKVESYNLKHLNLLKYVNESQTEAYDAIIKVCIPLCPKLKSLHCPLFKLEHSDLCCTLQNVEDLYLDCINSTSVEVNDVLKKMGGKLTSLTLYNCSVSLNVLEQCCHRLNHLTLKAVNIEYNENGPCHMFHNVKSLTIKKIDLLNPDYSKAICHILTSSPALENLYLKKCNSLSLEIKTEILKCCEQCALKVIHFYHCSVDAHFIKNILLACSTLETFYSDVCDMYSEIGDDLYRIAWSMPKKPEVAFCSESCARDYFSDSSIDWGELLDDYFN